MAQALTKFKAFGAYLNDPTRTRAVQRAILSVTGANTDTSYDIATSGGTFWTAAIANATYGTIADSSRTALQAVAANAKAFIDCKGSYTGSLARVSSATPTAITSYLSAASAGGTGVSETLVVTGLLATDNILAVSAEDSGANTKKQILSYVSAASVGATGVSETLAVAGLLATDTIISVSPETSGASTHKTVVPLLSDANAGAGAVVTFAVTGLVATDSVVGITIQTAGATAANNFIIGYGAPGAGTIDVTFGGAPGNGVVVLVSVLRAGGKLAVVDWSDQAADSLKVYWEEDPGAGAKVTVAVSRAAGKIPVVDWSDQAADSLKVYWEEDPGAGAKVRVLISRTSTLTSAQYVQSVTAKIPSLTFLSGSAPTSMDIMVEWDLDEGVLPLVFDIG